MTREEFSRVFDRCFDRVYAYVTRRVRDRAVCERVVRKVLETNLQSLVDGGEDGQWVRALKSSCDERVEAARAAKSPDCTASRQRTD